MTASEDLRARMEAAFQPRPCSRCGTMTPAFVGTDGTAEPPPGEVLCPGPECGQVRDAQIAERQKEQEIEWRNDIARRAVPPRYRWAIDFGALGAHVKNTRAIEVATAEAKADVPSLGLLLVGQTGTGKTSIAVALLFAYARRRARPSVAYALTTTIETAARTAKLGEPEPPLIHALRTSGLVVIDDLASEGTYGAGIVQSIVMGRHEQELPTIATTGFAHADIVSQYGAGVVRRLSDRRISV